MWSSRHRQSGSYSSCRYAQLERLLNLGYFDDAEAYPGTSKERQRGEVARQLAEEVGNGTNTHSSTFVYTRVGVRGSSVKAAYAIG